MKKLLGLNYLPPLQNIKKQCHYIANSQCFIWWKAGVVIWTSLVGVALVYRKSLFDGLGHKTVSLKYFEVCIPYGHVSARDSPIVFKLNLRIFQQAGKGTNGQKYKSNRWIAAVTYITWSLCYMFSNFRNH